MSQSAVDFHTTGYFTAPLASFVMFRSEEPARIAASLPDDGAFWSCPDFSQTEKELRADPRYAEWVRKTQV